MNTTLTVDDSLARQEVTIVITLPAGEQPRDERPALVSVGVAGQIPVIKAGVFGQVATLINEAWMAFSLHREIEAAEAESEDALHSGEAETIAETAVTETIPLHRPAPARPQNLSLF